MSENIHAGHRNRLKEEIISAEMGDAISPAKLLEMLLFYGIPRQDTAGIAKKLLTTFGDLSGVFDADIEDLIEVGGMTRNAASLIKLMRPVCRSYVLSKFKFKETLISHEEIGNYILAKYFGIDNECFSLLCLDRLGKVISFEIIMQGSVDSVGVSIRTVLQKVLKSGATTVVAAHNHPGGVAIPSVPDIEITKQLVEALSVISVNLIDHIIVANDDFVSMALSEKYSGIFGV